jgi:hypothetical protein
MRRCHMIAIGLLATVLCTSKAQSLDKDGKFTVLGAGANSCEQWTKARSEGGVSMGGQSWIQGFISSHNHYAPGPNDLGKGIRPDAIRSWVDSYCSRHPSALLVHAAEALIVELIRRHPPYDLSSDPASQGVKPANR